MGIVNLLCCRREQDAIFECWLVGIVILVCNWSWLPWVSYTETKRSPDKPTIQDHFKIVQRCSKDSKVRLRTSLLQANLSLAFSWDAPICCDSLWIGMNSIFCRAQPWGRWAATPREKASGAGFLVSADMSCEICRTSEFGLEMQGVADCEPKCQMWAALSFSTSFNFVHSMVMHRPYCKGQRAYDYAMTMPWLWPIQWDTNKLRTTSSNGNVWLGRYVEMNGNWPYFFGDWVVIIRYNKHLQEVVTCCDMLWQIASAVSTPQILFTAPRSAQDIDHTIYDPSEYGGNKGGAGDFPAMTRACRRCLRIQGKV